MAAHTGKVIWVTGASGALGGAIARHLATEGATVIASSRSVRAEDFVESAGIRLLALDVKNTSAVQAAADHIVSTYGRLDGVVVSTNVGAFGDFLELSDDAWYAVLEAKLLGSVRVVRAALPVLIKQGKGAVVVISGRGGIDPPPQHFPGSSVNAALDLLVQGLGRRYGRHGVRTNAIAPGPIRSPRYQALEDAEPGDGKGKNQYASVALGAPGEPLDVAHAASYLLSDAAAFVNGSTLALDGGGPGYQL
ncbi:Oxidoreductase [Bordetella tumbae]|uniref:SDR family NAD(P)-dependent oxidoreductase n=1 Tax=Bordetella tumbae TaxID=1649139 RepID=UPI0039EF49BB